jgi:hypothetical protein
MTFHYPLRRRSKTKACWDWPVDAADSCRQLSPLCSPEHLGTWQDGTQAREMTIDVPLLTARAMNAVKGTEVVAPVAAGRLEGTGVAGARVRAWGLPSRNLYCFYRL